MKLSDTKPVHKDALNHHVLVLLIMITLFKGIVWSLFLPPFFGQDEVEHFLVSQQITLNRSLNVEYSHEIPYETYWLYRTVQVAHPDPKLKPIDLSDIDALKMDIDRLNESWMKTDLIDPGDTVHRVGNFHKTHPPLYYALCAFLHTAFGQSSILVRVLACRTFSILLGCVIVLLAFHTGRGLWPDRKHMALLLAILVSFHPLLNRAYFSVISNGALETMLFSAFLYLGVRMITRGITLNNSIALGLILGMGLLTKISFLIGVLLTGLIFIGYISQKKEDRVSWRRPGLTLILPFLIAFAISFWWYIPKLFDQGERLVNTWGTGPVQNKISFVSYLFRNEGLPVIRTMIEQYWGHFHGGGSLYYNLVFFCTVFIALIVLIALRKMVLLSKKTHDSVQKNTVLSIGFMGVSTVLLVIFYLYIRYRIYYHHDGVYPIWSRYLLPGVIGQMAWLLVGISMILPRKLSKAGLFCLASSMIIINFYAIFHVISRRVYGNQTTAKILQAVSIFQPTEPLFFIIFTLLWCFTSLILLFVFWKYRSGISTRDL